MVANPYIDPFFTAGAIISGVYTVIIVLLIPIALLCVALFGRCRYFKAVGFEGWEGATPLYAWFAFGRAIGGEMRWLGLAAAITGAAAFAIPQLWAVVLIMEFVLLKNPGGKEGGFSTGMALGCVLLPFVFWHVAAAGVSKGR